MDLKAKQFRHSVMLKATGVSNDNLQNWLKRGALRLDLGRERHAKRRYSAVDVMAVAVMLECVSALRMDPRHAGQVADLVPDLADGMLQDEEFRKRRIGLYFEQEHMLPFDVVEDMPYAEHQRRRSMIVVAIGRIMFGTWATLDTALYGVHEEGAYGSMTPEQIARSRAFNARLHQYLNDDSVPPAADLGAVEDRIWDEVEEEVSSSAHSDDDGRERRETPARRTP